MFPPTFCFLVGVLFLFWCFGGLCARSKTRTRRREKGGRRRIKRKLQEYEEEKKLRKIEKKKEHDEEGKRNNYEKETMMLSDSTKLKTEKAKKVSGIAFFAHFSLRFSSLFIFPLFSTCLSLVVHPWGGVGGHT